MAFNVLYTKNDKYETKNNENNKKNISYLYSKCEKQAILLMLRGDKKWHYLS